jgi:hypothetical protein
MKKPVMKRLLYIGIYYLTIAICVVIVVLMLFTYMGGVHRIVDMVEVGWHPDTFDQIGSLLLLRFRQFLSIIFWVLLFLCLFLPFLPIRLDIKHKIAFVCLTILIGLWIFPWIVKWFLW